MGQKYRFRFADMIPNAWFYKLKDMGKHKHSNPSNEKSTTNSSLVSSSSSASSASSSSSSSSSSVSVPIPNHSVPEQRKSYYFTREITSQIPNSHRHSDKHFHLESPRKSSRGRMSTRRSRVSRREKQRPVTASGCNCSTPKSPLPDPTFTYEKDSVQAEFGSGAPDGVLYCPTSSECRTQNNPIDEDHKLGKSLHRINTKKNGSPTKIQINPLFVKTESFIKDSQKTPTTPVPVRRFPANPTSPGVKLRPNTPRIGNRRIQTRKNVGSMRVLESFAVVKSSKNPRRDFTSSMLEMIVENNLRGSKELEDLLACYLSLNADEYHDLIISVFKQIWFDVFHAPPPVGNK